MAEQSEKRVVGVYRDEASAKDAAEAARQAGGDEVQIGAPEDEVASLMGEMREETEHSWTGPSIGLHTKEQARGSAKWAVGCALIGAVVAVAVNFLGGGDLQVGARLGIAIPVGLVAGGTIGYLIGGGFFDPRRKSRVDMAAEQGVVVGATEPHEVDATDRTLAERDPIRVDTVDAEGPERTVTTEDRQSP